MTFFTEQQKRLHRKIQDELKDLIPYIEDPATTDIVLNPDGSIWHYVTAAPKRRIDVCFRPEQALKLIGSIAALSGTVVTPVSPLLQATLPGGQRFQAMIPPIVKAPAFSIRCYSMTRVSLDDYVPLRMPLEVAQRLRLALKRRENIVISGGTGSGKTTLTGAMLMELATLCPTERLCVMEDTRELPVVCHDAVYELTSSSVSMRDLLAVNMRMRPDRIILGEIRGPEALDLLKSWNTGHPGGISTVHANSAVSALSRFEQLTLEAHDLPIAYLRSLISDVVNLVVHIERSAERGPEIVALVAVSGLTLEGRYEFEPIFEKGSDDNEEQL